jgi:hypothetical protein
LIHGSIQIAQLSIDAYENFIGKPLIAAGTGSFAQAIGMVLICTESCPGICMES